MGAMGSSKHVVSRGASASQLDELDAATAEWDASEQTPIDNDTPVEQRILLELRDRPDDVEMRVVYADWLEERGRTLKARFLRLIADEVVLAAQVREVGRELDPEWRAIVSRVPVDKCDVRFQFKCPKRWEALASTDQSYVRHCGTCNRNVYFCTNLDEVRARGRSGECVAFCSTLNRDEALDEYDGDEVMVMGEIAVD